MTAINDNLRTISGSDIASSNSALPFGLGADPKPGTKPTIFTMAVTGRDADIEITGVTRVMLWADDNKAILRLLVADGEPLTMKQLVRAIQCGYLVSAQTASKWGRYKGIVKEHIAAGCHISTDIMPHQVDYQPTWKVAMSQTLAFEGYQAVMNEDGQLDIKLNMVLDDQAMAA